MTNTTKHTRNSAMDIIRIIAVLAVVMIHCASHFVSRYNPNTTEFVFGNLFDSIARLGVPLFLIISGALFLDERKEVTLKGILSKNVKSLAIITMLWAVIYALMYQVVFPWPNVDVKNFLLAVLKGHYHMWYLYMIMGLYIITPFLKKFVSKENKNMVLFFILFSFSVKFLLPTVDQICVRFWNMDLIGVFLDKFHLDFFGGYITYFLTGWYIACVGIDRKYQKYILYLLAALSLAFIFVYVHFTGHYNAAYENIGAPVFLYAVGTFLALSSINWQLKEKTAQKLAACSKLTFGVYLVHVLLLYTFRKTFPYDASPVLYILICFVCVVSVSFLFAYAISKIPIVKKIIRG